MDRYAYCIFCDDIRQEVGKKMSMMGIYSGELHVTVIPSLLPKLSIAVFCNTKIENPFKSLMIRVSSDETMMLETSIPQAELNTMQSELISKNTAKDPLKSISIGMHLNISPFSIAKDGAITVTAVADGEEMIAGKLRIRHSPDLVL